jgi:hypothetical protein
MHVGSREVLILGCLRPITKHEKSDRIEAPTGKEECGGRNRTGRYAR